MKEELDEARRSVKYYQGQIKNLQDENKNLSNRLANPIPGIENLNLGRRSSLDRNSDFNGGRRPGFHGRRRSRSTGRDFNGGRRPSVGPRR